MDHSILMKQVIFFGIVQHIWLLHKLYNTLTHRAATPCITAQFTYYIYHIHSFPRLPGRWVKYEKKRLKSIHCPENNTERMAPWWSMIILEMSRLPICNNISEQKGRKGRNWIDKHFRYSFTSDYVLGRDIDLPLPPCPWEVEILNIITKQRNKDISLQIFCCCFLELGIEKAGDSP